MTHSARLRRTACLALLAAAFPAAASAQGAEPNRDFNREPSDTFMGINAEKALSLAVDAPAERRPIMALLDKIGLAKPLDNAGINILGRVEGSWTWNFDDPDSDVNPFRVFDFEHNKLLLNQVDLAVERNIVMQDVKKFDVGFHVEMLYGADAGIIHSNGLFDYYDGIRNPKNQLDLPQAYITLAIPVGTGLGVVAGKFQNFVGYESIDPTGSDVRDFYSRSLIFFNYPYSHTGVVLSYDIFKNVQLRAGFSRGDNQSTEDNNSAISFLGAVHWAISDEFTLDLSNSTGPERADNSRDIRSSFDAYLFYTPSSSKNLVLAANAYYVFEENGAVDGSNANLFALALLGSYKINPTFTAKGRIEWIHDDDGFRLGPVRNIYEITLGLSIFPFPNDPWLRNIKIRPEFRWDHSPDDAFNGKDNQYTAAIDVVLTL